MTAIRKSMVFAFEEVFGQGKPANGSWIAPPPGTFISHTHTRSTNRVNATGSKKFDFIAYGKISGTWDWSFNLDYDYLEPLLLMFDDCSDGTAVAGKSGVYEFTLSKKNENRVPSFVMRIVTLNRMAGGDLDEILEIRGCVCKTIRLSQSAGSSQWNVSMSGFTTREYMWLGQLSRTDYKRHNGNLVQFACLFNGPTVSKDTYIANCDSIQISVENNAAVIDSTCTPFSPSYYEGVTNYQFTTSVYSIYPEIFKQRLYLGGQSLEEIRDRMGKSSVADLGSIVPGLRAATKEGSVEKIPYVSMPICKKLAPAKGFTISSFDTCRNDPNISDTSTDTLGDAYNLADRILQFNIQDAVIKSISWQRGDGQKIMDQLSSVECWEIAIMVRLPRSTLENSANYINPIGPEYDNDKQAWVDDGDEVGYYVENNTWTGTEKTY